MFPSPSSVPPAWEGYTPTTRGEPIQPAVLPATSSAGHRRWARERVSSGAMTRPRRGAYVESPADPHAFRTLTLSRLASLRSTLREPFVVVGPTAAVLLGLWSSAADDRVHIVVSGHPSGLSRHDPWLVRHEMTIPDDQIRQHEGLLVTSMERTAVDCARWLPPRLAQPTVDAVIAIGGSQAEMRAILEGMNGQRGVRNARLTVGRARASGSPFESSSRVDIVEAGLPMPGTLVRLTLADGEIVELDMAWRDIRHAVEADGDAKHENGADPSEERPRDGRVGTRGWSVTHIRTREPVEDRMRRVVRDFKIAWLRRYRREWRPE